MQKEITCPSKLLNQHGELIQTGYAKSSILKYNREDVARKLRLKEWDYYLIYNNDFGIALTVGKSASLGLISATFFNFRTAEEITKSIITLVPTGKMNLPKSSKIGDIIYEDKRVNVSFRHLYDARELYMELKNFSGLSDLRVILNLYDEPKESMVIATPFKEDEKAFYYNQKIIGMRVSGLVSFNNHSYEFIKNNSFGLLDWGRGVWPHNVTWYWGACQTIINEGIFGFNLGYGFGDTSSATENMLFYNGIAHKLEDIKFIIPKNMLNQYEYLKPWTISSSDQRLEMDFIPILDRNVFLSALVISTDQNQVFGKYNGRAILDDGTNIELKDVLGFAERVQNKW